MNLFQRGDFTSHSGLRLNWKIECDALNNGDWDALAYIAAMNMPPFRQVYGIPSGGMRFADFLNRYCTECDTVLIVDDVYTTGASMAEKHEEVRRWLPRDNINGLVVFSRSMFTPTWINVMFRFGL